MKNIAFWSNQLGERGTEIAMYDYAYYNQTLLNNKSFIFYEINNGNNNLNVINKFAKQFKVIGVNEFNDVDEYLNIYNIDIIYIIKSGHNDGRLSKVVKKILFIAFLHAMNHMEMYIVQYQIGLKIIKDMSLI